MANGNLRYLLRHLTGRHRISITDADGREVWYSFRTALRVLGELLLGVAVVFVASLMVAAYTKVLDVVPGYEGIRSRETMIENIIRIDSLERELAYMTIYAENVAQIMEGRGPVIRSQVPQEQDKITSDKEVITPSALDSLLRRQMEGSGRYGLNRATPAERTNLNSVVLLSPIKGTVVEHFAPTKGRYGVVVSVSDIQQVSAVQAGTVVMSVWENDGYTIHIQHTANLLSVYKGLGQAHKSVGERVEAGQAIGDSWNQQTSAGESTHIEIQFWYDGNAIDPEQYNIF